MGSVPEECKKRERSESVSGDSATESRESIGSTSCDSRSSSDASASARFGWPIAKASNCLKNEEKMKSNLNSGSAEKTSELKKLQGSKPPSEAEMMKERFAKLLLGEDMSGSGKGVCPALTISNAITNLCATVFGQLWRLEPLAAEKKSMWQREMDWLLSVSDHIVEFKPSLQTLPDGKRIEVMTCRPRSDLIINLPALRKLDNMLLDILDGFTDTEFWYVDQGVAVPEADGSISLQIAIQRREDKWWLPVPRVPPGGLSEDARKQLHGKFECANQILKAATAINSIALAEMEVPQSYLETLPKNGRGCLGDIIYRYITSEQFSPECLLDCLDLSSDHAALEIANRVEAAIHMWRRRHHPKPPAHPHHSAAKSSWEIVKDLMTHGDNRDLLAERAEKLFHSLKQRVPCLTQTTLDTTKIQYNKDVGKSILESYSRVLESLAFNIAARIEDLLYVDDITKQSDKLSSASTVSALDSHQNVQVSYLVPASGTPYRSAYTTPTFSPAPLLSPARGVRTLSTSNNCNNKHARRGLGVKRVLTNYLGSDTKAKNCGHIAGGPGSISNRTSERTTYCPKRGGGKESSSICNESRGP